MTEDAIFDAAFGKQRRHFGPGGGLHRPAIAWQNPFVERLMGSIRRESLDHVIVLNERHLQRILRDYVGYYHRSRTHLALDKDTPESRSVDAWNEIIQRLARLVLVRGGGEHPW